MNKESAKCNICYIKIKTFENTKTLRRTLEMSQYDEIFLYDYRILILYITLVNKEDNLF